MKKRRAGIRPDKERESRRSWMRGALLAALLVVVTLPVALFRINNSDVWWHIACGREMLGTWAAPDLGRFYFSPVQSVSDFRFTFLGDVLLALVFTVGGAVGLQLLVLACAAMLILLLRRIGRARWNGWTLLLLALTVFGTGQILLVRNSLFALPMLGLLLWLMASVQFEGHRWRLYLVPVLIGLWGTIHGSYLLGFVVLVLLLVGGYIDALRKLPGSHFHLGSSAAVIVLSFALITVGNPMTTRFLRIPWTHISGIWQAAPATQAADIPLASPDERSDNPPPFSAEPMSIPSHDAREQPWPERLKRLLNSLVWSFGKDDVRSGDFQSPFDRLNYLPVLASLALAVVALVSAAFFIRPLRFAVWLPFVAILIHGMGYVRSVGFIAIFAAWSLLVSARFGDWRIRFPAAALRWGERGCVAVVGLMAVGLHAASLAGSLGRVVGQVDHVFGFGKIPAFDGGMYRFVLENTEGERIFTTIVTGSYALDAWRLHKPVFVDGFFAPHPRSVWSDYLAVRGEADPDRLYATYGISLALIENSRSDWNLAFLKSKHWIPCAIGLGATLYRYNDRGPKTFLPPELLFSAEELKSLPDPLWQHRAAAQFYNSIMSLHAKGRAVPALDFRQRHDAMFRMAFQFLVPWERDKVDPAGVGLGREYVLTR